jgi:hypothetical protein
MPSNMHEIAIAKVLQRFPTAKTRGFIKEVCNALGGLEEFRDNQWPLVPDAFIVDHESKIVEVEATHPINDEKMERYADLWWSVDGNYWDLLLITTDKWGNQTGLIDMGDYAIDLIFERGKKRPKRQDPEALAWMAELRRLNPHIFGA